MDKKVMLGVGVAAAVGGAAAAEAVLPSPLTLSPWMKTTFWRLWGAHCLLGLYGNFQNMKTKSNM